MEIRVYGGKALRIKNGQTFKAKVTYIEGRTVVILEGYE